ncbi:hypothetical protein [Vibrio lentus]|uniref:hypothetical protein n=1 Tax=Vibrio lentus TaxID=136468 RepID=UPI001E3BB715|nr:hypothetical protein [Vibrio lentus]MCC4838105.1 hypothetical protein [Vibrio lentus]
MVSDENNFKWVFNPPKKAIKQPDVIALNDFDSLITRLDNEGVDPPKQYCGLLSALLFVQLNARSG